MKSLIVVIAVICAAYGQLYDTESDVDVYTSIYHRQLQDLARHRQKLRDISRKFEEVCPGRSDDFEEALLQSLECIDKVESTETLCSLIRNYGQLCTKPVVKVIEECMPEESREIPSMLVQGTISAVNYVCKSDGEHIFELGDRCFATPSSRGLRCVRKVKAKMQQYKNKPPNKNEICEALHSLKPCIHTHLRFACDHQITRESFMGAFEALTSPCTGINAVSNSTVYNEVEQF